MKQETETIQLKQGGSTKIICQGLATAGYQWNFTVDKKDIVSITKDIVMPSAKNKLIGASADEVFMVTANKKGVVNIYLFQKRSWEKEVVNERRVMVEIV